MRFGPIRAICAHPADTGGAAGMRRGGGAGFIGGQPRGRRVIPSERDHRAQNGPRAVADDGEAGPVEGCDVSGTLMRLFWRGGSLGDGGAGRIEQAGDEAAGGAEIVGRGPVARHHGAGRRRR